MCWITAFYKLRVIRNSHTQWLDDGDGLSPDECEFEFHCDPLSHWWPEKACSKIVPVLQKSPTLHMGKTLKVGMQFDKNF